MDWHFHWYVHELLHSNTWSQPDKTTVVGFWSLLSDRIDGSTRCHGKDSSSICAHFLGDCAHEIREDRTSCFCYPKFGKQCFWLRLHDHDWVSTYLRSVGNEFRGSDNFDSAWRFFSSRFNLRCASTDHCKVVLYTAVGGLKATFLTDYLHTTIALILIIYFTLAVLTNSAVGGLSGLYDKVVATAGENYIPGNYEGSLLTFKSKGAIIWGLILKFGNLALVVMVRSDPIPLPGMRDPKHVHYADFGLNRTRHSGRSLLQRRFAPQSLDTPLPQSPYLGFHGA